MGYTITQRRPNSEGVNKEFPILFDSISLNRTQQNYGTYKRELLSIIIFIRKFGYYFSGPIKGVVFTDYKPLIFVRNSSFLEGIYVRWVDKLRPFNFRIEYIPGPKNRVADSLSRTIFPEAEYETDKVLEQFGFVEEDKLGSR